MSLPVAFACPEGEVEFSVALSGVPSPVSCRKETRCLLSMPYRFISLLRRHLTVSTVLHERPPALSFPCGVTHSLTEHLSASSNCVIPQQAASLTARALPKVARGPKTVRELRCPTREPGGRRHTQVL